MRRVQQTVGTTKSSTETFTEHAPVFSRRFPDRYTLVTTTLRPVHSDLETDIPIEPEFDDLDVPAVPRYLGRRHSLDAGVARMDLDTLGLGTMDLSRAVTTSRTIRSMSRPPRPRPMHPPVTRPEYIERRAEPRYDVDLYWITRQQLLEEPDITSKFQPLKHRLHQIGAGALHPIPSKVLVSPVSRAGDIPHFTSDFEPYEPPYRARNVEPYGPYSTRNIEPYDPLYRTRRVRAGGPLYIHSVGEDPRTLSHSELEPMRKDGVVCVMVGYQLLLISLLRDNI